jgi:Family of unknown function (DUF6165)
MEVMIPVSWGELFDKLTILQIKSGRISDSGKLENVRRELAQLETVVQGGAMQSAALDEAVAALHEINSKLWVIEDDIRDCERERCFDAGFIGLARAVYYTNDERAALKQQINTLTGSELVEEKSYSSYS